MSSGGPQQFAPLSGTVVSPPEGIDVPAGANITFWRLPTDKGALFAYSGFDGRTDYCGLVASGVDLRSLGDAVAPAVSAREHSVSATPARQDWVSRWLSTRALQFDRYWGDDRNSDLIGAELAITLGASRSLFLHYHATKVF